MTVIFWSKKYKSHLAAFEHLSDVICIFAIMERKNWIRLSVFFALYALPVTLLWLDFFSYEYRVPLILLLALLMLFYCYIQQFSWRELGFRKDNLKPALFWNGLLAGVVVLSLVLCSYFDLMRTLKAPEWALFYAFYVFVSSPAQEFLYRSVTFAVLKQNKVASALGLISLSAVNYSYLHIFYNDVLTLLVTLMMGLLWGVIYYKYPNFWGTAFSHAVLGATSIFVGLI